MKAHDGVVSFIALAPYSRGKSRWLGARRKQFRKHGIREGLWEQTAEDLAISLLLQSLSDTDSQVQARPERPLRDNRLSAPA